MTERHDVMRTKKAIDAMTIARARQVVNHGFTSESDDKNIMGEMAKAAACYALGFTHFNGASVWPFSWSIKWWKPSNESRKRDIEKACALLIAEWERLDRIEEKGEQE